MRVCKCVSVCVCVCVCVPVCIIYAIEVIDYLNVKVLI